MTLIDRRILIADLAYLGDTLMSTPVITNLRRNHPRAIIDFLVSSQAATVVEHHPDINEVLVVEKAKWQRPSWQTLRETAARLREKKYDTVFVVHRAFSTALVMVMAGIPRRLGLATDGRSLLLTDAVPLDIARHRTDNALALLVAAGEPVTHRKLSYFPGPGADRRAEGLLLSRNWDPSRPLICIAPGGSWKTKCWPAERFSRTAEALLRGGYQIALVGGPAELELSREIATQAGEGIINLTNATTFDVLYEIFRLAQGVIATDSGPMHLAAASGVPLVGLFGPTSPQRCGPVSDHAVTIAGDVPCLGCYLKECDHHSCMAYLGVRTVLSALESAMVRAGTIALATVPAEAPAGEAASADSAAEE